MPLTVFGNKKGKKNEKMSRKEPDRDDIFKRGALLVITVIGHTDSPNTLRLLKKSAIREHASLATTASVFFCFFFLFFYLAESKTSFRTDFTECSRN